MKYAIAVLLLSLMAVTQDATVVELSKSDATQAKQLYEQKVAAEKAWDDFNSKLTNTYKGFSYGITFSSDFRFVVPKLGNYPLTVGI